MSDPQEKVWEENAAFQEDPEWHQKADRVQVDPYSKRIKAKEKQCFDDVAMLTLRDYMHKVLKYCRCHGVLKPWVTMYHRQLRISFVHQY